MNVQTLDYYRNFCFYLPKAKTLRHSSSKGNEIQNKFYKTYAHKLTKLKSQNLLQKVVFGIRNFKFETRYAKTLEYYKTLMPEKPQSNAPNLLENEIGAIVTEPNETTQNFNKYFVV